MISSYQTTGWRLVALTSHHEFELRDRFPLDEQREAEQAAESILRRQPHETIPLAAPGGYVRQASIVAIRVRPIKERIERAAPKRRWWQRPEEWA